MVSDSLETLRIAHTARCKLQMAVDRPDRNFRFILGHALTLDNVLLRFAEINLTGDDEGNSSSESDNDEQLKERHVGFSGSAKARGTGSQGAQRRSPPPPVQRPGVDVGDDDDDEDKGYDEGENGAPLERFPSGSARPPREVAQDDDEGIGDMDGNSGREKGSELSEEQLKMITEGHGNVELVDVYNHIAGCPCHGQKAPAVENVWEIPSEADGQMGGRRAVLQVQA